MNRTVKKVLSLLSASAIICTALINASAVPGDTNDDKVINSIDALDILNYSVGKPCAEDFREYDADYDGDGVINSTDALYVLELSVGLRKELTNYDLNESADYFTKALKTSCSKVKKVSQNGEVFITIKGLGKNIYDSELIEDTTVFKNGTDENGYTAYEIFSPLWYFDDISEIYYAKIIYPDRFYQADVRLCSVEIDLDEALKNPDKYDIDLSELEAEGFEILSGKITTTGPQYSADIQKNGLVNSLFIYQEVTESLHVKYENKELDIVVRTNFSDTLSFTY